MPGDDGVTAIRELSARKSPARILVLTTYDSDNDVVPAIQAGASGYVARPGAHQRRRSAAFEPEKVPGGE